MENIGRFTTKEEKIIKEQWLMLANYSEQLGIASTINDSIINIEEEQL